MLPYKKAVPTLIFLCVISTVSHGMKKPSKRFLQDPTISQVNTIDAHGKAPIHRAIIESDIEETWRLLKRGAKLWLQTTPSKIEAPDFMRNKIGYTPFHLAARNSSATGIAIQKILLYFALLQNTPSLLLMFNSQDMPVQAIAIEILQDRATCLKKILEVKTADGNTAGEIQRKSAEWNRPIDPLRTSPLLSAYKINHDLRAFVTALSYGAVALLPDNNAFKAAHDAMPK